MRAGRLTISLGVIAVIGGCSNADQTGGSNAQLRQARTCEEVLESIKADAVAKVDLQVKSVEEDLYYGGFFGGPFVGDVALEGGGPVAAPTQDGGAEDAPSGTSDTNRQVAGVDEADIVKIADEGRKLFVIRGNGFYEFDAWPAAETSKAADLEIEGYPREMFVDGDRAVVFSDVYGVEALDDGDLCQGQGVGGAPEEDIAFFCTRSYVKVTVIDLEGESPSAVRELYIDGWYNTSRRHDDIVRFVVQTDIRQPSAIPDVWSFIYADGEYPEEREERVLRAQLWAAVAKQAIADTTLEEWLPVWGEVVDGEVQEQPAQCGDFYTPSAGLTDYGLTQVIGLDMDNADPVRMTSILGWSASVYANGDALVLTQPDYGWYGVERNHDRTLVHRFAVSEADERTPYEGSGFVPGLARNQFSIDERDGTIRIATTRTTWSDAQFDPTAEWVPPVTHNFVSTMRLAGEELSVVGATPPLAEGEMIFSARFIGDLGYIVTFRRVDPLFAIDLSDEEAPTVLGELKIPGFSDYMHPLGEDHLLTIGRDVDEETQIDNGTALQIFNVANPTDPQLAHKALVGEGFSAANHDHKAFNFYDDKGVLAFPFVSYESGFSSTLELWAVDATEGFSRLGAIDHSTMLESECSSPVEPEFFFESCGYQPQISRGVFIDNYIYSISHGGVLVHGLSDLESTVATASY